MTEELRQTQGKAVLSKIDDPLKVFCDIGREGIVKIIKSMFKSGDVNKGLNFLLKFAGSDIALNDVGYVLDQFIDCGARRGGVVLLGSSGSIEYKRAVGGFYKETELTDDLHRKLSSKDEKVEIKLLCGHTNRYVSLRVIVRYCCNPRYRTACLHFREGYKSSTKTGPLSK